MQVTGFSPVVRTASQLRKSGQVIVIRGIDIFSLGMNDLAKRLRDMGIPAQVSSYRSGDRRAVTIATAYRASRANRPVILVGHSFGADEALRVAAALDKMKIPVELLVAFDPTIHGPVTKNVNRCVNFHTAKKGMWSPVVAVKGYRGTLINRNIREEAEFANVNHFSMDNNKALQDLAIQEVKRALR